MRYSTYVKLNVALFVVTVTFLSIVYISLLGGLGVALAILFWVAGLIGLGVSIAWIHRAVSEFQGSPFPGLLGVMGFDIYPDDPGDSPFGYARPNGGSANPPETSEANRGLSPVPSAAGTPPVLTSVPTSAPDGSGGPVGPAAHGCSECGAVTQGADSRFCRICGAPLEK